MISGGGGKVYKGKNPWTNGWLQVTVQRSSVVKVDAERNLLLVKGGIPGAKVAWLWFATRLNLLNNHLSKGGLCNAYSSNI